LSDKERERLLRAVRDSDHPHLLPIVLIALTTGARRNEVLGLRWRNVDLKQRRAVIDDTKNGERRSLALVPQVVDELKVLNMNTPSYTAIVMNLTHMTRLGVSRRTHQVCQRRHT
jgi:integrase